MSPPLVLHLDACADRFLTGGKAAGLARLLAEGFPVPPGLCFTVEAYRQFLRDPGHNWSTAVPSRVRHAD